MLGELKQNSGDFWTVIKPLRGLKDDSKVTIDSECENNLINYFTRLNSSCDNDNDQVGS